MLAGITTRGRFGAPTRYPGPGKPAVAGPVVTLSFTLALAGPVPNALPDAPQQCQAETPNVALQVAVVDQNGDAVDISSVTAMVLWMRAPDGSARPVVPSLVTNGLDGLLQYVTSAVDLSEAGLWQLQAQLTFETQVLLTAWGEFQAAENIPG